MFSSVETERTGGSPQPPRRLSPFYQPRPIRPCAVDGATDRPSRQTHPLALR